MPDLFLNSRQPYWVKLLIQIISKQNKQILNNLLNMSHFERPRSQLNPLDPAFVNISPTKLNLQPTGVSTSYIPPQPYPIQSSALRTLPMQNPEFGRGVVNLRPSIVAPMAPIPAHFQSRISSRPSIPVYKAQGPPIPPIQSVVQQYQVQTPPPVVLPPQPIVVPTVSRVQPIQVSPPIVESIVRQRYDPQRETVKRLYQSKGYTEQKKGGCPWLLPLLGLLALAGLLTGLYFLIRSGNSGSNRQVRAPIQYKQTAKGNTTNQTNQVIDQSQYAPKSPVYIDQNTTANTTVINNVPVTNSSQISTTPNQRPPQPTSAQVVNTTAQTNSTAQPIKNASLVTYDNLGQKLTPQQIKADPNVQKILNYIKSQKGLDYTFDSTPKSVYKKVQNGKTLYNIEINNNLGRTYMYGVNMAPGAEPQVVSATSYQEVLPSTKHQVANKEKELHRLRSWDHSSQEN